MSSEAIQTRKDEIRYHTADFNRAVGKFLASPVLKKWNEDFTDEGTGEVVTIERTEIIMQGGTYISPELTATLNFHKMAGDIDEIEVSNQRRLAKPYKLAGLKPYRVSVEVDGKKYSFILQAQSTSKAIEVANDYVELNYSGSYAVTAVKHLDRVIILNDRLLTAEEAQAAQAAGEGEEKREDTKYYKIEVEADIRSAEDTGEDYPKAPGTFIVRTKDADTAKAVIRAYIEAMIKREAQNEGKERTLMELTTISAAPFSCNAIIDRAFCYAYKEEE